MINHLTGILIKASCPDCAYSPPLSSCFPRPRRRSAELGALSFGPVHHWGEGKSAMPMCSMEQKRCISVASRGMTRETRKRGNGDDEWGTKNIYPADASNPPSIFQQWLDSSKEVHLHHTLRCLSASQRSTLRWMISYGLMMVPADWLSARSVSVELAFTVHNVNRRTGTVERRCGASWFVAVGLSEGAMTNAEWKCHSWGMRELPLNLSKRDSSSQKSVRYVGLFLWWI